MAYGREPRREAKRDAGRTGSRGQSQAKTGPEWWVERWQRWVKEMGLASSGGQSSARIKRLEIGQGNVVAVVQERSQTQCRIDIRIAPWTDSQWNVALDAIAGQAHFAAQLAGGELPQELDAVLVEAGVPLLPQHKNEIEIVCQGAGCSRSCPHAAVVIEQLGAALADDPWLLLRMRGRDQAQMLGALRKARTTSPDGGAGTTQVLPPSNAGRFHRNATDAATPEETPSLAAQMAHYWGVSKNLEGYRPHFYEPKVDAVLLRRLGPLPFSAANDDIYEDVAAIYRSVSAEALRQAFAPDSDQG